MRRLEWPGIAVAATLICAGAITYAIWRDPDGFKLKDWQTSLAAMVALAAATMAYRGAMAKVDHDRERAQVADDRERLSLFLKLEIAIGLLGSEVKRQRTWTEVPFRDYSRDPFGPPPQRTIEAKDFQFETPPEFDEAWNKLDLFDDMTITAMANIRSTLRTVRSSVDIWGMEKKWIYSRANMPEELSRFVVILGDLERYCDSVTGSLKRLTIKKDLP